MKIYDFQEEKQKRYEESIKKRITAAFPNAECYKNTKRAIQIWHNIWLPKSEIKIVWGELQDDIKIDVRLSVPK